LKLLGFGIWLQIDIRKRATYFFVISCGLLFAALSIVLLGSWGPTSLSPTRGQHSLLQPGSPTRALGWGCYGHAIFQVPVCIAYSSLLVSTSWAAELHRTCKCMSILCMLRFANTHDKKRKPQLLLITLMQSTKSKGSKKTCTAHGSVLIEHKPAWRHAVFVFGSGFGPTSRNKGRL
jgi:hypothetical protein